ncbi:MAG TPA: hypothetical protein ENI86_11005 [Acidimicrobiales bacterium]|nr:hypothetical protein [Acidimicrobiales bacterium]
MNPNSHGARGLLLLVIGALLAVMIAPGTLGAATEEGESVSAAAGSGSGYLVLTSTGAVRGAGGAVAQGGVEGRLTAEPVTLVTVDGGRGYYVVESNGKVTGFGSRSAGDLGDLYGYDLDQPIVDMVMTPSGQGYYLLGRDGGVFAFGDAEFLGSVPQYVAFEDLVAPVVAMLTDAAGTGYWIFAADGGVFAFGTAGFHGALPSLVAYDDLVAPVVGATRSSDGAGYGLVGGDGGVFAFGSFDFLGSLSATPSGDFVDLETDGSGYVLLEKGGDILGPDGSSVSSGSSDVVGLAVVPDVSVFSTTTTTQPTTTTTQATTTTTTTTQATTTTTTTQPTTTTTQATTTTTQATTTTTQATTTTTQGGGGGGGGSGQVVVYDSNGITATGTSYAIPTIISPPDLTGYINGQAYLRLEVTSKASSLAIPAQVCFWNDMNGAYKLETCASTVTITGPGVYYKNLGSPNSWWKLTGSFPWYVRPDHTHVMMKHPTDSNLLMMWGACGTHCSPQSFVSPHVPITVNAKLIFVAPGSTFQPPAGW